MPPNLLVVVGGVTILYAILNNSKLVLNSSGIYLELFIVSILRKLDCLIFQTGVSGFGL
jgi:hypothetical protein